MTDARLVKLDHSARVCSEPRCRSKATHRFTTQVRIKRGKRKGRTQTYTRYVCDFHAGKIRNRYRLPVQPADALRELPDLRPGEPCTHPGCAAHVSHPCEGCGRYAAGTMQGPANG